MRRIHHPPIPHENAHMLDIPRPAVRVAPEQHIALLGLRSWDVFAHAGVVLRVCGAGDGFVEGAADGVLG